MTVGADSKKKKSEVLNMTYCAELFPLRSTYDWASYTAVGYTP